MNLQFIFWSINIYLSVNAKILNFLLLQSVLFSFQVQKAAAVPRNGFYESNNDGPGWVQNYNNNPPAQSAPHVPCCNNQGGGGMMTTAAPSSGGGITITLGQGLPLGPLGILRQMLRPKVDLKKKLFFGVQLENGIGFGGNNNNGGGNTQMMGGGGQMNQGHMGGMGGGYGQQGGGGGGGGGITYHFGK